MAIQLLIILALSLNQPVHAQGSDYRLELGDGTLRTFGFDSRTWAQALATPNATGNVALAGPNLTQPYPGSPIDGWSVSIAMRADIPIPSPVNGNKTHISAGVVAINPPVGMVEDQILTSGTYEADHSWRTCIRVLTRGGITGSLEPNLPFYNATGVSSANNGSCDGIFPQECITSIEQFAEEDELGECSPLLPSELPSSCGGFIGGNVGFGERGENFSAWTFAGVANPTFNGSRLASFASPLHESGNLTGYNALGSQAVPVMVTWQGIARRPSVVDGNTAATPPRSRLVCVRVTNAAEGSELPGESGAAALQMFSAMWALVGVVVLTLALM